VTQTFPVALDAGTLGTLSLGQLPLGPVAITGQAFNAVCASIASQQPSWVADKQVLTLQAGVVASLTMTFRPDNPVSETPAFVGNVAQVTPSAFQTDVVMSDGTVEASGTLSGTLGNTTAFGVVSGLSNIASMAISQGDSWQCALLKSGSAECWGDNGVGQLGNGTTTTANTPVTVSGLSGVTQISAGVDHACAATSTRSVFCWGYNAYGQLGNGTTANSATPGLTINGPSSVVCGGYHTCALQGGSVWCWGYNAYGQLGSNSTTNTSNPTSYGYMVGITQLALGWGHTCGLRADGNVFCWGYNAYGQLGIGNLTNALVPTQVPLSNVTQIVAGYYSTCARRSDGTVWCWGLDVYGQIGDGSAQQAITSPVQVLGLPPSTSISAGYDTACSIGSDLSLECWGYNGSYQLGTGTTDNAFTPMLVRL
jgi:hypothetical protein